MLVSSAIVISSACGICFLLTFLVRRFALRAGLTDHPDGHRKLHVRPIPLGGGIAVYLAASIVLLLVLLLPGPWGQALAASRMAMFALPLACLWIVVLGVIDDYAVLRGRHKLLGQVVAAGILVLGGLRMDGIDLFGFELHLGLMAAPVTIFWLVGAINAVNLLDGVDGLAATIGAILCATVGIMGLMLGNYAVACVAFAFTGSLLGFLPHNFPPARIFLGDAGSMLIGMVVGALAIRGALKGPGTVLLAAPLAVFTIPIFDSAAAILRRKLTGRSIYSADRAHLHHRLLHKLGSNVRVLALIAAACAVTSLAALVSVSLKNDSVALAAALGVIAIFVTAGLFGRVELVLLMTRLKSLGASLTRSTVPDDSRITKSAVRIQGTHHWEILWEMLTESADKLRLSKVRLDVNVPSMHESYNATWERPGDGQDGIFWRIDLPLVIGHHRVGSLLIVGSRNGDSARDCIEQILDMLEPFEAELAGFAEPKQVPVATGN